VCVAIWARLFIYFYLPFRSILFLLFGRTRARCFKGPHAGLCGATNSHSPDKHPPMLSFGTATCLKGSPSRDTQTLPSRSTLAGS